MRIPRYWQKAETQLEREGGKRWVLSAWGWSDEDDEQAAAHAQERLEAQATAVAAGRPRDKYLYHDRPLREQILQEPVPGTLITRNGYGATVLNSDRAAFIDVDLPQPRFFQQLFGGKKAQQRVVDETLQLIKQALRTKGRASCRVYRTYAGLRLLLTHATHSPTDEQTHQLLQSLGADPLYLRLCRIQECFRARLTPKPWRCDLEVPPHRWPYADGEAASRARAWLDRYERTCEAYATTRFVTTIGTTDIHDSLRTVVDLHDRHTRATARLPLA